MKRRISRRAPSIAHCWRSGPMRTSAHRFLLGFTALRVTFFFFNDTATTEIYTVSDTLSLPDALPISVSATTSGSVVEPSSISWTRSRAGRARRSEEHTSELQSPDTISYAVFCLKKKKKKNQQTTNVFLSQKNK